jgi:hypothetical protein
MNPEERELLLRSVKLGEENRTMLRAIRRTLFWTKVWGVIKIVVIVIPFIIGYFYLQPYLGSFGTSISQAKDLISGFK